VTDLTLPDTPADETALFLSTLFGNIEDGLHGAFWTRGDKQSSWFDPSDPAKAAALAQKLHASKKTDLYLSVSVAATLPPTGRLASTRISSEQAAGIVGLWADIDVADPNVHKKTNLPATMADAHALVAKMGLPPTIVINSGHGLQCWWLFHEFWSFDSKEDRGAAAALAQRWSSTMLAHAVTAGQMIDSVYDLARLMRVPGMMNLKDPAKPVPVKLLQVTDARYTVEDFSEHCLDDSFLASRGISPSRQYETGDLVLEETGSITVELLEVLKEDDRFRKTWEKRRTDLTDQSGSSYDLSLASQAAALGCDDQTIADLIIAFRRKHKLEVSKALRQDYMARTISKARDSTARENISEAVEDVTSVLEAAKESGDPEDMDTARRQAMDLLGQQLGLEVVNVFRYASDPPTFRLATLTRSIDLGGADGILNHSKFLQSVYQSLGILIPDFKRPAWRQIAELMSKAWVEQDLGFEATERGEMYSWLSDYLRVRPPLPSLQESLDEDLDAPYVDATGRTVLFLPGLKRWLFNSQQERLSLGQLGKKMRTFGADNFNVATTSDSGKPSKKSAWVLPLDWRD
jgi:hypothetical protein